MASNVITVLIIIWTIVAIGLALYLIYFPILMRKKIKLILDLLERIATTLEKANKG